MIGDSYFYIYLVFSLQQRQYITAKELQVVAHRTQLCETMEHHGTLYIHSTYMVRCGMSCLGGATWFCARCSTPRLVAWNHSVRGGGMHVTAPETCNCSLNKTKLSVYLHLKHAILPSTKQGSVYTVYFYRQTIKSLATVSHLRTPRKVGNVDTSETQPR